MRHIIYILIIFCFSCSDVSKTDRDKTTVNSLLKTNDTSPKNIFIPLDKLFVLGDFNGDELVDTIFQNNINTDTKSSIDSIPIIEFDSLQGHFDRLRSNVILSISTSKTDTLYLGPGRGLFCLINIGDNNNDKKDEIALVVDNCSFSNITQCQIYTLCKHNWVRVNNFSIHRSAFDYNSNEALDVKKIKGFLEYKNKKWMYIDYFSWFKAETDKDTMMMPLKIKKVC